MQTRRPEPPLEKRATAAPVELRDIASRRIGGRAATFRSPSENLGGFIERIDPRFFNKSQGDGWAGVQARYQHSHAALLGTTQAKTLRLDIDSAGLNYEVDVPQSRGDVLELVQRGDVQHSSIAFETFEDDWTTDSGMAMRTLLSGRLIDVAPVTAPAYRDTTVALRSLADYADADPADVLALAAQGELRKLLCRSDRRSDRVPTYPGTGHRWAPTLAERRVQLMRLRYPGGQGPPVGRDGRQALLEILAKRWPHERRSGRQAMIEIMGKRWTAQDYTGWQ